MTNTAEKLFARAQAIRSRAAVRRWEVRQFAHAGGAWFQLGRLLTLTSRAWVLGARDGETLVAAGRQPHSAGLRFEPPRRLFVVGIEEIVALKGAREIAVQTSIELLLSEVIALVPFEGIDVGEQDVAGLNPEVTRAIQRAPGSDDPWD